MVIHYQTTTFYHKRLFLLQKLRDALYFYDIKSVVFTVYYDKRKNEINNIKNPKHYEKSILSFVLLSLVMILTSFTTPETKVDAAGNGAAGGNVRLDAAGNGAAGGNVRLDAAGNGAAGGNVRLDASGNGAAGGNVRLEASGNGAAGGNVRLE